MYVSHVFKQGFTLCKTDKSTAALVRAEVGTSKYLPHQPRDISWAYQLCREFESPKEYRTLQLLEAQICIHFFPQEK